MTLIEWRSKPIKYRVLKGQPISIDLKSVSVASRRSPILAILQKYTKNFSLFRCGHGDYVIHYHYFGVVTLLAPYERRRVAQFWTNQGKDQGFMDQIGPYTVIGTPDRFVYP